MPKTPIPKWCKKDCFYRDKKAKYSPACTAPHILHVQNGACVIYKKGGE